jgi:hypothetical protein
MAWRDAVRDAAGLPALDAPPPSDAPRGLTPAEQMAHAAELMRKALGRTAPREEPTAILTGGQPGSGKSYITRSVGVRFEGVGGLVVIDPDEIRPTLPYMKSRIEAGDLDVPDVANVDAGTIAYQMVQIAKRERRNVLVDGTLQNTGRAVGLAEEMREARYGVEFHGMAVYPDLSHARTYTRREEQIEESPTGFGRGVSDEFHDQAVRGYSHTVDTFQRKASVDSMTFYGGEGRSTVQTRLENGSWVPAVSMADELRREHERPTPAVLDTTTRAWRSAVDRMQSRGAPAAELAKVMGFRDAAVVRSVKAQISIAQAERSDPPEERAPTPGERVRALSTLVHAGVAAAGRNADATIMTVAWTPDEAVLEVKAPAERGYSRVTLPGHEAIEKAIHAQGPMPAAVVDFADGSAGSRVGDGREIERAARGLGVDPSAFGISIATAPAAEREVDRAAAARTATIAALREGRGV